MSAAAAAASPVADPHRKRRPGDFTLTTFLGEGSFSQVRLGIEKASGREMAIKICEKQKIIKEKKTEHVIRERNILSHLKHPFIVQLLCTFQDETRLYFCLSLAKRGEMLTHLQRAGCFDEVSARFYTAEIILALEYLHANHVVHRDLKPENILLGWNWHILLADFGTAKSMPQIEPTEDADGTVKSTFVGTAQYVSPEVLGPRHIYYSSDLWALGCVLYQLLAGTWLFFGPGEYAIFQLILKVSYTLPETFPAKAADLIGKLVVLDRKNRLGCKELGGMALLKEHEYFEGFNWSEVDKQTPPPLRSNYPTISLSSQTDIWEHFYTAFQGWGEGVMDDFKLFDSVAGNGAEKQHGRTQAELDRHKSQLKQQAELYPIWHPFCKKDIIEKTCPVKRHKGYKVEELQLILTDKRFFSVDPEKMAMKREMAINSFLYCEVPEDRDTIVLVHEGTRSSCFEFEDAETTASWIKTLEQRRQQQVKPPPSPSST